MNLKQSKELYTTDKRNKNTFLRLSPLFDENGITLTFLDNVGLSCYNNHWELQTKQFETASSLYFWQETNDPAKYTHRARLGRHVPLHRVSPGSRTTRVFRSFICLSLICLSLVCLSL